MANNSGEEVQLYSLVTFVVQKVKMYEFTWNSEKYITLYVLFYICAYFEKKSAVHLRKWRNIKCLSNEWIFCMHI
jgi:uncharacterized membrane protein YhaH (DUF805 family)